MSSSKPIGIFDSGIGGLSIARHISDILPLEHQIYIADTNNAPYGNKSVAFLQQRTSDICRYLIDAGCKLIVIACNTATVNSVKELRAKFHVPFVGVEPGIKPAVERSKNGKVAILATQSTLASQSFRQLVEMHKKQHDVILQPCPGLADIIEKGNIDSEECRSLLTHFIEPLISQNVDTIALGCTHYPFVKEVIESLFAKQFHLIDTSVAVANQVQRLLTEHNLLASTKNGADQLLLPAPSYDKKTQIWRMWHADVHIAPFELANKELID